MSDDLAAYLREGRIADAREMLVARVTAKPADVNARLDLVDVLILLGEWDKADTHADLAATQDMSRAVAIALTRQLIRAAAWRDDAFEKARPPELVTEPDVAVAAALARIAGTDPAEDPGEGPSGTVDDRPFTGLRDLDDRTAGVLEVLTSTGKYMWVPFPAIVSLKPEKPEKARDLVWRPAELEVADGPTGMVYLPATYHAKPGEADGPSRLARATDWVEEADGGVRGIGARCLLIGDDMLSLDGFTELTVSRA